MNNIKTYAGSVLVAALLLTGCGDTTESAPAADVNVNAKSSAITANTLSALVDGESARDAKLAFANGSVVDTTSAEDKVKAAVATLVADGSITAAEAAELLASADLNEIFMTAYFDAEAQLRGYAPAPKRIFGIGTKLKEIGSKVTDKVKDGLVDVLDTKVGQKITGAAFDVVLNSEGVTVFMLDQARNSETMTQIMIDALDANWDLTEKMCPMLQTNSEFGEKFAALAEERESMAHFFFHSVDAPMYGCLTDAMLLSNNDAVHHSSVSHSTNAYMGILLERYATTYFITPDQASNVYGYQNGASTFKFASLMMDNGENVIYDRELKTFTNHGDANELISEKFFYSLFKTPGTTDAFVAAMDQLDPAVVTMFMDKIFLGAPGANATDDTYQGYLNIISIGSAMYDGIFGMADTNGDRSGGYGFSSYSGAFIGFAQLIPTDRYMTYGTAFVNAGYEYAAFYGIDVWSTATQAAQDAWTSFTTPSSSTPAPARSAGLGLSGSDWLGDTIDLFLAGWDNVSLMALTDALLSSDQSVITELNRQAGVAYATVLDGKNASGEKVYATEIGNDIDIYDDEVYGFHGLVELAIQEDIFYANCGNQSTDHIGINDVCENNTSYTMADAKASFALPAFADITWEFAYGAATDGVTAYWNNNVNAQWLADLSNHELVVSYFYPSADNAYIPSWLLAIDWLKIPANMEASSYADLDISFDGGYMDVYVVSANADLLNDADLVAALAPIKDNIEASQVVMGEDSIIAVDENNQDLNGLYVYKIRVVTAGDTEAVLAALSALGNDALNAIGIDSDGATQTVAAQ